MNIKKLISLVTASMIASTLLFSGCTSKTGEVKPNAEGKPVTIRIWHTPQWKGVMSASETGADYDSFFKYAALEFTKKNPNIKVQVEVVPADQRNDKLSVAMQTKTLPDMFYEASFAMSQFVHSGVVLPLNDIIDDASQKDIPQAIWDSVTIENNIYWFPFSSAPGSLMYNADMFKKAGLDKYIGGQYDIASWTPEEYKTILETLKAKLPGVAPMGLFAKNNQADTWNLAYLRMFGTKFFDENSKLVVNDEAGVKALTYIVDVYKSGLTAPGAESLTPNDCSTMFQNQKIAINFGSSANVISTISDMKSKKASTFDLRIANIPGQTPLSFAYLYGTLAFDTGDAERIEASKKFIKFVSTDPELVKASKNGVPVRDSVIPKVKGDMPYLDAYSKNTKNYFNFSNNVPGYAELRNVLFPELQAALTGAKTPKQALDSYTEKGNAVIEKNKKLSQVLNK